MWLWKKIYNIIKECIEKIENEKKLEINKKYQKNKKIIHFKGPLKIEKQNRFYYHSLFNKMQYHISEINLKNSTNINNNIHKNIFLYRQKQKIVKF